jgi:hypothetical protein
VPPKPVAPKPVDVTKKNDGDRLITYDGSLFYVSFPKHDIKNCLDLVRDGFQGRRFDRATLRWMVSPNGTNAIFAAELIEDHGFKADDAVVKAIKLLSTEKERVITVEKDKFMVRFAYDRPLWEDIKTIPMTTRKDGVWYIKQDVGVVERLQALIVDHSMDADEAVYAMCEKLVHDAVDNIAASRQEAGTMDLPGWILGTPYPFQLAGIEYGLKNRRALIADEMGLGKTAQALIAAVLGGAKTIVVVCPASVKYNWAKEIYNWFGDKWTATVPAPTPSCRTTRSGSRRRPRRSSQTSRTTSRTRRPSGRSQPSGSRRRRSSPSC